MPVGRTSESLETYWQHWSCTEWSWENILKFRISYEKCRELLHWPVLIENILKKKMKHIKDFVGNRKEKSDCLLSVFCCLWKKLLMLQTLAESWKGSPNISHHFNKQKKWSSLLLLLVSFFLEPESCTVKILSLPNKYFFLKFDL